MLDAERKAEIQKRKTKLSRSMEENEQETLQAFLREVFGSREDEEPPEFEITPDLAKIEGEDKRFIRPVQWVVLCPTIGDEDPEAREVKGYDVGYIYQGMSTRHHPGHLKETIPFEMVQGPGKAATCLYVLNDWARCMAAAERLSEKRAARAMEEEDSYPA